MNLLLTEQAEIKSLALFSNHPKVKPVLEIVSA